MHTSPRRFLLALVPALNGACLIGTSNLGDPTDGTTGSTSDTPTSTADPTTAASTASDESTDTALPTTSTTEDPSSESSSSTDDPSTSSNDTTTGGLMLGDPCDVWTQDCAAGLKCNPWIDDGGIAWNAARCVDIVDDPDPVGAACSTEPVATGNDTCVLGSMCFFFDVDTWVGTCVELCGGSEEEPQCAPETACGVFNDGALPLCFATCDPLAPDCPDEQACYARDDEFLCMPVISDTGDYLDDCTMLAQCNPNHLCIDGDAVTGCEFDGCCTPICDLGMPDTCPEGSTGCVPYYEEGQAPEGFEWVGFCG